MDNDQIMKPANTLRKSNVILWFYFGSLRKLLSANVDVTQSQLRYKFQRCNDVGSAYVNSVA